VGGREKPGHDDLEVALRRNETCCSRLVFARPHA
jgi:hypothetical protein